MLKIGIVLKRKMTVQDKAKIVKKLTDTNYIDFYTYKENGVMYEYKTNLYWSMYYFGLLSGLFENSEILELIYDYKED